MERRCGVGATAAPGRMVVKRYLLDTNAVISLLSGNAHVNALIADAFWVGISIITELEFLSFPGMTEPDRKLFETFANRIEVVDLLHSNQALQARIARLRQSTSIKLPDAIIMASAIHHDAILITADQKVLNQWPEQTLPTPSA